MWWRAVGDDSAMTARPPDPALLPRLERYYDAVPRPNARVEAVDPFTLFISEGDFPYYARPRLGLMRPVVADDVAAARARQRELGVPEAFEWVVETTPSLGDAAAAAGLVVRIVPLLVLDRSIPSPSVAPDATIRRVDADDPDLERILAVASVAFSHGGTASGEAGMAERDAVAATQAVDRTRFRQRIAGGATVLYLAEDVRGPVASGAHQPVDGVSEIVGVATLPTARRAGLGAAVTSALVDDALAGGVGTVFLSAASDEVARIYERLGFVRVARAGLAEAP
jgi:ribosomal protein S18 acetylase RimI-like enzyme